MRLYGAGLPPARVNPRKSQRPAGAEKSSKTIKIRERTNPSHLLSVIDFEYGERAKAERAHQWGTVFQTALPYFLNTRDFVLGYSRFARYWLPAKAINNQTTRQQYNQTTSQFIDFSASVVQSSRQGLVCVAQFLLSQCDALFLLIDAKLASAI